MHGAPCIHVGGVLVLLGARVQVLVTRHLLVFLETAIDFGIESGPFDVTLAAVGQAHSFIGVVFFLFLGMGFGVTQTALGVVASKEGNQIA